MSRANGAATPLGLNLAVDSLPRVAAVAATRG